MGDVNWTYAGSPSAACGCGPPTLTTLRVMQPRSATARHTPAGNASMRSAVGSTGAAWLRYGSGSEARAPASKPPAQTTNQTPALRSKLNA